MGVILHCLFLRGKKCLTIYFRKISWNYEPILENHCSLLPAYFQNSVISTSFDSKIVYYHKAILWALDLYFASREKGYKAIFVKSGALWLVVCWVFFPELSLNVKLWNTISSLPSSQCFPQEIASSGLARCIFSIVLYSKYKISAIVTWPEWNRKPQSQEFYKLEMFYTLRES